MELTDNTTYMGIGCGNGATNPNEHDFRHTELSAKLSAVNGDALKITSVNVSQYSAEGWYKYWTSTDESGAYFFFTFRNDGMAYRSKEWYSHLLYTRACLAF